MLGPEQLNLAPRLLPQTFSTLPLIQINNEAARALSLNTSQVITALIALEHGRLYLKTRMSQEPVPLPAQYIRWVGKEARFQVSLAKSGLTTLTPVSVSPHESVSAQRAPALRGSDLLRSLITDTVDGTKTGVNFESAADVRSLANFSTTNLIQNPIAQLLQIFQINGYKIVGSDGILLNLDSSLMSELLKMLRKIEDPNRRANIVDLIEELKARITKADSAQKQDLFVAELLALLDEVPVDLSFFRGQSADDTSEPPWIVNLGISFDEATQVSIQIRLDGLKNLFVDVWLTNPKMFREASDNETVLRAELLGYGIKTLQINIFDGNDSSDVRLRSGNLDVSI